MSTVPPLPDPVGAYFSPRASLPELQPSRRHRVLACELCQQRKVKCDRQFPCANCVRSRVQCIPATLAPRRRRRKFPERERELLERIHKYEALLRSHNISYEHLNKDAAGQNSPPSAEAGDDEIPDHIPADGQEPSPLSPSATSEREYEAKSIWHAMSHGFRDPNDDSDSSDADIHENLVKKAWDKSSQSDDHLLFGARRTTVDLSTLHPNPAHIFRLWQTYLDNVNPLLKITHTPTLQGRIIGAASNLSTLNPTFEALLFGIYCVSMLTIGPDECEDTFGSPKKDLLVKYQFGCQQALLNSGFLRCNDRDCLTALFLYLISVRPTTAPQSLSTMLGVAVRIARRMGIHNESSLSKCTPLEAEMRRRLWWSLVVFDARISELAAAKTLALDPTWDCKIPLNVGDSDLRPEMTELPAAGERSTEAIFAVVHSELGDFIRHSEFYLEFTIPALKPLARQSQVSPGLEDDVVARLEDKIENQYLKSCDQENPIHFMTIWTARIFISRYRFLQNLYRVSKSIVPPTAADRDAAAANAIRMLECDSKVMTCPLTKGFLWIHHFRFPFPAYFQLCQYLRRQSSESEKTQRAWEVMSDNYEAWFGPIEGNSPFFSIFARVVLQAWEAHESAVRGAGGIPIPPRLVDSVKNTLAQAGVNEEEPLRDKIMGMGIDDRQVPVTMPTPAPTAFPDPPTPYQFGMGMPAGFGMPPEMFSPAFLGNYANQMHWNGMGNWQNW